MEGGLIMCVKDGTNIRERTENNRPCGWCVMAKCPQAKKKREAD